MVTRLVSAIALAAAMLPTPGSAAPFSLDQALQLAAGRSQAARGARAAAAGAAEATRAAGQLPDPVLSAGIDNLPVTGPERLRTTADSMTMKRLGISQEWVSSGKRSLRQAVARAQAGRESVQEQLALADTRLQAALAYLDAYYASEALQLTTLAERHAREEAEAAQARLSSALGSSQEVLQLAAARGIAEDESADVRQLQASAFVALQRWVGPVPDSLAAPALPPPRDEPSYVASHPAVLAAQRDIEVARAEAAATASNREPNWTWQASYGQRTGLPDMVSIGVSIPLPVAPQARQDRETAARLALVEKAEAALEEATRMAAAEFRGLAGDARRLGQRIARYQSGVVAPAQQRVQAALAGYRSNQAALVVLFEARHAELETRRKLLALQRDLARVQAQLAFKTVAGGAP